MKTYEVKTVESVCRTYSVNANDAEDAKRIVETGNASVQYETDAEITEIYHIEEV